MEAFCLWKMVKSAHVCDTEHGNDSKGIFQALAVVLLTFDEIFGWQDLYVTIKMT